MTAIKYFLNRFRAVKSRERGSVLFVVLMFVVFITSFVLLSNLEFKGEVEFVESEKAKFQAYVRAYSGYQYILNRLLSSRQSRTELVDANNRPYKTALKLDGQETEIKFTDLYQDDRFKSLLSDELKERIDKMGFKVSIQDSAGLLNMRINRRDLFINVLKALEVKPEDAEIVYDSIIDWRDPDDLRLLNGAEKAYYESVKAVPPPNRELQSMDELRLVRGVTPELFEKVRDLLDFTPSNAPMINPNTMPRELFKMFWEFGMPLSDTTIDRIIEARQGMEFQNYQDFEARTPYDFKPFAVFLNFFTSDTFYIKITSAMSDQRYYQIQFKFRFPGRITLVNPNQPPTPNILPNPNVDPNANPGIKTNDPGNPSGNEAQDPAASRSGPGIGNQEPPHRAYSAGDQPPVDPLAGNTSTPNFRNELGLRDLFMIDSWIESIQKEKPKAKDKKDSQKTDPEDSQAETSGKSLSSEER